MLCALWFVSRLTRGKTIGGYGPNYWWPLTLRSSFFFEEVWRAKGFLSGNGVKRTCLSSQKTLQKRLSPCVRVFPGGGHGDLGLFLPGDSCGLKGSQAGYNPQGGEKLAMTEVTEHDCPGRGTCLPNVIVMCCPMRVSQPSFELQILNPRAILNFKWDVSDNLLSVS